jgi:hypothetical protein
MTYRHYAVQHNITARQKVQQRTVAQITSFTGAIIALHQLITALAACQDTMSCGMNGWTDQRT